jgi:hypothetical protein
MWRLRPFARLYASKPRAPPRSVVLTDWPKVNALAVTPDGRHVVSGSDDETLRVWDLATVETKTTLQGHTRFVTAVAVTPDGRHVVSGSWGDTLRVWDLRDGKEIVTFTLDAGVTACIVAPDNRTIIAADNFGQMHLLRFIEADETKLLPGDTDPDPAAQGVSVLVAIFRNERGSRYRKAHRRHSRLLWFLADVIGLSNNVVSF